MKTRVYAWNLTDAAPPLFDDDLQPPPGPPGPPEPSDAQLQMWAVAVTHRYRKAVAGVVGIGHDLNRIKAQCPHGSFARMFTGDPQAVATPIPFRLRTAEMFMAIAENPILSNPNHGAILPRSWRTLYELSCLTTAELTKALDDGRIHPEMERHEVLLLRLGRRPPRSTGRSQARARQNAQRAIANTLRRLWDRYPEEHAFLLSAVAALARPAGRPIPWDDSWPELPEADQEAETA